MKFMLDFTPDPPNRRIRFTNSLLLMGSCFTEHIGSRLTDLKMQVMQNPNGILFDPQSITNALRSYLQGKPCRADDLFLYQGAWHSWQHHSRFSHVNQDAALARINESRLLAAAFLKKADWLIITLGTAFSYRLAEGGMPVANCHKIPARQFTRHLMSIEEIVAEFDNCLHQIFTVNPEISVLFTVSPVRHLRDGLMENARSKARLLEAVHHLVDKFSGLYYFPAYEWVTDVLRDYRFYAEDMAHPTEQAANFVFEKFIAQCMDESAREPLNDMQNLLAARNHRPLVPGTSAWEEFQKNQLEKITRLQQKYPQLNWEEEKQYFSTGDLTLPSAYER